MKTVEYNGKTYYVNGASGELKDLLDRTHKGSKEHAIFNLCKPVYFYNHKNFQGNPDYLSDAVGILENVKQPTAGQVRHAMIWGLGYPGEGLDYAIKAGGESASDSMFSSSLKVMIAHPKTGLDTDVVILKKYSKNIEDVYITEKEVRALFNLCKTPVEQKLINESTMMGCIDMLWRSYVGLNIDFVSGPSKKATAEQLEIIKNKLFEVATNAQILAVIDRKIAYSARDLETTLMEGSSCTTAEFHEKARKTIGLLNEFKVSLLQKI